LLFWCVLRYGVVGKPGTNAYSILMPEKPVLSLVCYVSCAKFCIERTGLSECHQSVPVSCCPECITGIWELPDFYTVKGR